MTKLGRGLMVIVAMGVLIVGLSCCQKKEGPVERTGKQIDKAVEKADQHIEKAGEKTGNAIKDATKK